MTVPLAFAVVSARTFLLISVQNGQPCILVPSRGSTMPTFVSSMIMSCEYIHTKDNVLQNVSCSSHWAFLTFYSVTHIKTGNVHSFRPRLRRTMQGSRVPRVIFVEASSTGYQVQAAMDCVTVRMVSSSLRRHCRPLWFLQVYVNDPRAHPLLMWGVQNMLSSLYTPWNGSKSVCVPSLSNFQVIQMMFRKD